MFFGSLGHPEGGIGNCLCGVRSDFLDFDHDQLEKLADEETLCIIVTHLFGIPSEIGRVRESPGEKESPSSRMRRRLLECPSDE